MNHATDFFKLKKKKVNSAFSINLVAKLSFNTAESLQWKFMGSNNKDMEWLDRLSILIISLVNEEASYPCNCVNKL